MYVLLRYTACMNSEHYASSFLGHRRAFEDFYAQLPADKLNFKAWEGGMSFLEQANHLAGASQRFMGMVRGETVTPDPAATDLAGVQALLKKTTEETAQAIRALPEADLSKMVTAFGGLEMPVAALLDTLIGHEAHHKGQVWLMARLVDIKPPMFIKRG